MFRFTKGNSVVPNHRVSGNQYLSCVGRVGVAIDSLEDMEQVFDGIPLNTLKRVSMLGNSFGPAALSLFIALGEKQGLKTDDYVVDLQNDILKEYVARGTYIFPIVPSVRIAMDVVEYCAQNICHWYPWNQEMRVRWTLRIGRLRKLFALTRCHPARSIRTTGG